MLAIKFRTHENKTHGVKPFFIGYVTCCDQNVYAEMGEFSEVASKIKEEYARLLQRYQIQSASQV